jgi:hypothetical protein
MKKTSNKIIHNETIVSLSITEFECSPSEITKILNITPSKTWQKNEPIDERIVARHKENGWRISSSLSKESNLEEHIKNLSQVIIPHKAKFKNLPSSSYVELSCCIYVHHEVPEISFSANTIQLLSELQAEIDIDLYCLMNNENFEQQA